LGPLEGAGTIFVLSELKDDWQSLENQESWVKTSNIASSVRRYLCMHDFCD
jgi:hypothetical protein